MQAYRLDSSNSQVMRDLASLQIQARALEGFKESRRLILTQKVICFHFIFEVLIC